MSGQLKVRVDHLAGARRGEHQILELDERVRIGRHPDCDVAFDSHKDLDASSRHAELREQPDGEIVLRDVGSSNGTYVDGARVTLVRLRPGQPLRVEFGVGGPVLRLFLGDDEAISQLEQPALEPLRSGRASKQASTIAILIALIVAALVAIWWRFTS